MKRLDKARRLLVEGGAEIAAFALDRVSGSMYVIAPMVFGGSMFDTASRPASISRICAFKSG